MIDIKDIWEEDEESWNENLQDTLTKSIQEHPSELGIRHLANAHKAMQEMIEAYFDKRYKIDPEWRKEWSYSPSIKSIEINNDSIDLECSAPACGCGCSGYDHRTFTFPMEHLWNQEEALAGIKAEAEAKQRAAEEAKQRQEAESKKKQEEAERQQWAALAAKYGETK